MQKVNSHLLACVSMLIKIFSSRYGLQLFSAGRTVVMIFMSFVTLTCIKLFANYIYVIFCREVSVFIILD